MHACIKPRTKQCTAYGTLCNALHYIRTIHRTRTAHSTRTKHNIHTHTHNTVRSTRTTHSTLNALHTVHSMHCIQYTQCTAHNTRTARSTRTALHCLTQPAMLCQWSISIKMWGWGRAIYIEYLDDIGGGQTRYEPPKLAHTHLPARLWCKFMVVLTLVRNRPTISHHIRD